MVLREVVNRVVLLLSRAAVTSVADALAAKSVTRLVTCDSAMFGMSPAVSVVPEVTRPLLSVVTFV